MHINDEIDDIRKHIIRFSGSPEEARAFVAKLAATDWNSIFIDKLLSICYNIATNKF
jgi:hypothetical protein